MRPGAGSSFAGRSVSRLAVLFFPLVIFCLAAVARAEPPVDDQVPAIELGQEYKEYKKTGPGKTRVHNGESEKPSTLRKVLLYLPNRILDFLDIFRFDVGVGPALGGVVRLTKYGQVGVRELAPGSLRVGLRGRKVPMFLEHSNEFGIGPAFVQSRDREVGESEVGAGLDFLIVGAYVGIDLEAVGDFFVGLGGFDPGDDDL